MVVTRCTTPATGVRSIRALTGPEAERALLAAELVEEQLNRLEGDLGEEEDRELKIIMVRLRGEIRPLQCLSVRN